MSDLSKVCGRLGDGAAGYVMAVRLDDLAGYWLELNCCDGVTLMPCQLLARQRRTRHPGLPDHSEPLRELLPRMRCKRCGGLPKEGARRADACRTAGGSQGGPGRP